ncbi:MAG: peptidylprolyl isomerase, partial [Planctomycetes bacterium]|nr:peptidylprolyl isomerase [Planctomycetota bacterium]
RATALALGARLDVEAVPAVRDALAWSLAELAVPEAAPSARAALRPPATVGDGPTARWTRVFALRALSAAGVTEEAELLVLAADPDPQLQLAALAALARRPASALTSHLLDALRTIASGAASAHVRARAIALLGDRADPHDDRARHALADAAADPSPSVRRAALHARARLDPAAAALALDAALASLDPFDRAAAATAAARLPDDLARPRLSRALDDATPSVRAAAVAALATKRDLPELDAWLARAAADVDLAVAEELAATLTALAPGRGDLARAAFARRPSSQHAEARKALLGAIVACDPEAPDLDATLRSALDDPDLGVRLEAARRLAARGAIVPPFCDADRRRFPRVGVEVPVAFLATRPRLELVTTRGRMVVALAPAIAPVHCWNLCQLAARGALDGLPFHRVVPDFVVQGGDSRGDGYGNLSIWGGNLRAEIDAMPFLAGTVGMPRSAEPDSGGGQFFVTLGPAPHLDGRYTALGRVVQGLAVAELIEIGDRIERVLLLAD